MAADSHLASSDYASSRPKQFKLPKVLREVSGLALDERDRLFAHDDEQGIVYQVDYDEGRIVARFALHGGIRADFEGIATADGRLFLVASNGTLYETRIGGPEALVPFEQHAHSLDCEVEGLTRSAGNDALLVACKNLHAKDKSVGIRIYSWRISDRAYDPAATLTVPRERLRAFLRSSGYTGKSRIQPTGIAVAPNGNLIILAGRQHLLLELTTDGDPVGLTVLDESHHRQAEGIAITSDHRLLLADEGDNQGGNKSRGRLSIYEPAG